MVGMDQELKLSKTTTFEKTGGVDELEIEGAFMDRYDSFSCLANGLLTC
jgi:hypothetical protein